MCVILSYNVHFPISDKFYCLIQVQNILDGRLITVDRWVLVMTLHLHQCISVGVSNVLECTLAELQFIFLKILCIRPSLSFHCEFHFTINRVAHPVLYLTWTLRQPDLKAEKVVVNASRVRACAVVWPSCRKRRGDPAGNHPWSMYTHSSALTAGRLDR